MKFIDQATIWVSSGAGGPGCVSFRREKYLPRGGPDGGDGGRGGDVVLEAAAQKETLWRFHLNQHFWAGRGRPGQGSRRSGAAGAETRLVVPPGTVIFDAETGEELADLAEPGAVLVVARGGRGGLGNCNFASGGHRAPRYAQPGEAGLERRLRLELRLLAEAGLVGYPNVGKSTLISRVSAARPKIADYPFTTLIPNLGVVEVEGETSGLPQSFVLADLPGLIDGAAEGAGLGHRFLKHLSRCTVLVHLLDPLRLDLDQPARDLDCLGRELLTFDPDLVRKSQLVALGKMDLAEGPPALAALKAARPRLKVYPVSSATGAGLKALVRAIWRRVEKSRRPPAGLDPEPKQEREVTDEGN